MLHKARRAVFARDNGGFVARPNMPGWLLPRPVDHGHGPLAMVVESLMVPGRLIAMHEHRNDEIVSWVPDGVMRHEDSVGGKLVADRDHLMVMNAGRSIWHSEETHASDPHLRMLQIFVRPRAADLEPGIQHGPLPRPHPNAWRHVVGPEGGAAPFFVRNAVDIHDIRLDAGAEGVFPEAPGRDLYFYVFSGALKSGGKRFAEAEQGLLTGGGPLGFRAEAPSVVVAFLIDPLAPAARQGTIGDMPAIPRPSRVPLLRLLAATGVVSAAMALGRARRRRSGPA